MPIRLLEFKKLWTGEALVPSVTRTNPVSVDAMSTRDREGPYSLRVYEDDREYHTGILFQ